MFGLIKNQIKTKIGIVLPASYPASRVTHESVSVTADGSKTFAQMLSSLYSSIDPTKITKDSKLVYTLDSTRMNVFSFVDRSTSQYVFSYSELYVSGSVVLNNWTARIGTTSNYYWLEGSSTGDASGNTMPSGRKFTLYYD